MADSSEYGLPRMRKGAYIVMLRKDAVADSEFRNLVVPEFLPWL